MSSAARGLPVVAIVGRPNVGKSTLYNRLVGGRLAIVDAQAGLTRDRLYGRTDWGGHEFMVVDTAGLDQEARGELEENTRRGTVTAIEEADVVIFLVDVRVGISALDQEVADMLRRGRRPVVLAANKAESPKDPGYVHELFALGFGEPLAISAEQGTNIGDLLDAVAIHLPTPPEAEEEQDPPTAVTILGRPNVGKSSLLNAILGDERSMVAAIAGTTRDPVDTEIELHERRIRIVDTAGIRRKGVTKGGIEHYSVLRGLRALERADVVLLVIDATEGVLAQDQHIAGYAVDAGKGVVLVVNKWDLLPPEERDDKTWRQRIDRSFQFLPGAPVIYASAKSGRRVEDVLPTAMAVADARKKRVSTGEMNRLLRDALASHPPPFHRGKQPKVMYAAQGKERTPTFVFFVNDPDLLHFSYKRYLENKIREVYGFEGVPLRTVFRRRGKEK
ncbi:MAG TPA: ribosome biogenesis GTPase Der [Candidatus Dormibacteraeota bacterium]|jgi:GTP-binding protein